MSDTRTPIHSIYLMPDDHQDPELMGDKHDKGFAEALKKAETLEGMLGDNAKLTVSAEVEDHQINYYVKLTFSF